MLARAIELGVTSTADRAVRREIQGRLPADARSLLAPLFLAGLPGGYLTAAHATSFWLRKSRRAGGPAIVTSAWLGWLVHRGVKLVYRRERPPRAGERRRTDSYPSGHTTGVTALAVASSLVLKRQNIISGKTAAAVGVGAPLVMGIYRLVDDEHWTTDVIGGWMLGSAIALTCTAVLGNARGPRIRPARRPVAAPATRV